MRVRERERERERLNELDRERKEGDSLNDVEEQVVQEATAREEGERTEALNWRYSVGVEKCTFCLMNSRPSLSNDA